MKNFVNLTITLWFYRCFLKWKKKIFIVVAIKDIHTRHDTSIVCIPPPRGPSGNHSSWGPFASVPWSHLWVLENRPCQYGTSGYLRPVYVVIFKYAYGYATWSFCWLDNVPSHSNLDHCILWWSGDLNLYSTYQAYNYYWLLLVYGRDYFP